MRFADCILPCRMRTRAETEAMSWHSAGVRGCPMHSRVVLGGYIEGEPRSMANTEGFSANTPGRCLAHLCPRTRRGWTDQDGYLDAGPGAGRGALGPVPSHVGARRCRTVVTWGYTAHQAVAAATALSAEGLGPVEIIDLRSIIPCGKQAVFASVRRTTGGVSTRRSMRRYHSTASIALARRSQVSQRRTASSRPLWI